MNRLLALALLVPATVMVATTAQAAETGNVSGVVVDGDGLPIPGAEVKISGPNIAGELTTLSTDNGSFSFPVVPVGAHDLTVNKGGFSVLTAEITVGSDRNTYVPAELISGSSEEITVEGIKPTVDATRSSLSTEMNADLFQNLPVGRSYQSVLQLAPGVSGRVNTQDGGPGNGNPSVRGEGQYGNNYLIDGISIRDPATKTFGGNVNFDAIESIQVFTDGMPAEYSQGTGMLVNVVTKDGGDEHHGTAGYWLSSHASGGEYDILDFETGEEEPTTKRKLFNNELSLTAGGPIIPEKLWYFAGVGLGRSQVRFEGSSEEDDPYISNSAEGFGKITWFATPDLSLQYQIAFDASQVASYQTSGQFAQEAQSNRNDSGMNHILTARWRPTAVSELELKGSYLQSVIAVVPASGDEDAPSIFDEETGEYTNNFTDFDYNRRSRIGGSLKFTYQVPDLAGSHRFKIGAEAWQLKNNRELIYTGAGVTPGLQGYDEEGNELPWKNQGYSFNRNAGEGFPCTADANYADCKQFTEYEQVGKLGNTGNLFGGFIQDDWTIADLVTLNIGVRMDREVLLNNADPPETIIDQWMPAPRFGGVWDVTGDNKTKLSVNAGRYYDINGNTFAGWGNTRSANVFGEFQSSEVTGSGTGGYDRVWLQDPTSDPLIYCNQASLEKIPDGNHPELAEIAKEVCGDKDVRPYHLDKLAVAFEREVIPLLAVGIRGIISQTVNLPEDIDHDLDLWVINNPENKRRDYRAIELTVNRKFDGVYQLMASYTLSESKGHMPGQFELASGGNTGSNGNAVGVYMDDIGDVDTRTAFMDAGFGWLVDGLNGLGRPGEEGNDAGYYGYLPYHSFHVFKLSGSYTMPWGTTVSGFYEFDSGNAWQKRGLVGLYGDYFALPEGRGSRFMPALHYFDLRAAHKFDLGNDRAIEVTADVFNLFDFAKPNTYYQNDNELFGKTMFRQAPRSIRVGARFFY